MSYKVGSIVSFSSPTKNAILKGQIVLKKNAKDMFERYTKDRMQYEPDDIIYSIRVFEIIRQKKDTYHEPQLCKVSEDHIKGVLKQSQKGIELDITDFKNLN